jgi:hypothetical protein
MNLAKHAEYMDRAFNAEAMPAPYAALRVVDAAKREASALMAQQYRSGVAEGWRQAHGMIARHGGALIAFGVCVGVTLAVIVGPMLAFMGAGA